MALSKKINRIRLLEKSSICAGFFCKRDVIIMPKEIYFLHRLYPSQIQTALSKRINRIRLLEKSPICAGFFCKRDVIIMKKTPFPH